MSEKLVQALQPLAELRRHPDPAEHLYPEDEGVVENALQIGRGALFDMKVSDIVTLVRTRELRGLRQDQQRIAQLEDQLRQVREQRDELLHLAEQAHREIDEHDIGRMKGDRPLTLAERCRFIRTGVAHLKRQWQLTLDDHDEAHGNLDEAGIQKVNLGETISEDRIIPIRERCRLAMETIKSLRQARENEGKILAELRRLLDGVHLAFDQLRVPRYSAEKEWLEVEQRARLLRDQLQAAVVDPTNVWGELEKAAENPT